MQDVKSMHGGFPPDSSFPLQTLTASTSSGLSVTIDSRMMCEAQQYNTQQVGYMPLVNYCRDLSTSLHAPQVRVLRFWVLGLGLGFGRFLGFGVLDLIT